MHLIDLVLSVIARFADKHCTIVIELAIAGFAFTDMKKDRREAMKNSRSNLRSQRSGRLKHGHLV